MNGGGDGLCAVAVADSNAAGIWLSQPAAWYCGGCFLHAFRPHHGREGPWADKVRRASMSDGDEWLIDGEECMSVGDNNAAPHMEMDTSTSRTSTT